MSLSSVTLNCTQLPSAKEEAISRNTREAIGSELDRSSIHCILWQGLPSLNPFFSLFYETPAFLQKDDGQEAAFALPFASMQFQKEFCQCRLILRLASLSKTLCQWEGDWIVIMVRLKSGNGAFCSVAVVYSRRT